MQWRHLVEVGDVVDSSTLGDEQFDGFEIAAIGGGVQGRQAALVADLDVAAALDEERDNLGASFQSGNQQRRLAGRIGLGYVGSLIEQLLDALRVAVPCRVMQRAGHGHRSKGRHRDECCQDRFHRATSAPASVLPNWKERKYHRATGGNRRYRCLIHTPFGWLRR
ncbi:hypothetical protein D9M72_532020 [compost metagenome]